MPRPIRRRRKKTKALPPLTYLPPEREAAYEALALCLDKGQDIQAALNQKLTRAELSPADARLATELVYGHARLLLKTRHVVFHFLKNPEKLPPELVDLILLAAHELLHLDRVPAYATVSWAVEGAKAFGKPLAGLVNGVLRNVDRLGDDAHGEDFFRQDDPGETEFLSRYHSCPEWIVDLWLKSYGEQRALEYLKAQSQPPALGLAVNPWHEEAAKALEALEASPGLIMNLGHGFAFAPHCTPDFAREADPALVSRRSLASRQALDALAPASWPGPVWDCCAGRGGKTRLLMEYGHENLVASDPNARRLKGFERDMEALGLPRVKTFQAGADQVEELPGPVATILADAPCSGLGVLSRRPDAKYKRTPDDLSALQKLQRRIVDRACALLPPGGTLAYVTCTLNPGENEDMVRWAEEGHGMKARTVWTTDPAPGLGEFFFASLLVKPGN